MSQEHNGWTNYETWLCKLWMDEDQYFFEEMAGQAFNDAREDEIFSRIERAAIVLDDRLKEHFQCIVEETLPDNGFVADLLNSAFGEINWHEIAEHLLEGIEQEETIGA